MPQVSDYVSQAQGTYHDVTGRLIRTTPHQVQKGTDALGNPIFVNTTFAWAPPCYPRNGARAGQTTANISLRNNFDPQPSNLSIAFIKDGVEYRRLSFPATMGTTSTPTSIPAGTYTLRLYKKDLNYQAFLFAGHIYEVQSFQDCTTGFD